MSKQRSVYGWVFIWLLLILGGMLLGKEREWPSVILAVLIHELGHCLAAFFCGADIKGFSLGLFGARLKISGLLSYSQELWIAAGGPLANFLCIAILSLWRSREELQMNENLWWLYLSSLGLGLLNLIPVGSMDGGRILRASLSFVLSPEKAAQCLKLTTLIFLIGLWLIAVYALLQGAPVMSGLIFIFSLLLRYVGRGEEI